MYSASGIVVCKKKSLISIVINLAPWADCEIVLLISSLASSNEAAGDTVLSGYCNLSPPTVTQTLYFSVLSGQMSHTMFAYVTICP